MLVATSTALVASESRVALKDLPEAVQKTVKKETRTAKLLGVSKEVEKGKTYYEAGTIADGKSRDLLIDASDAVVEVEQEVALDSIPEQARTAIRQSAGSGKIVKVESVTKGSVVSYEPALEKNGKRSEVAIGADGTAKKED